jgi:hypothetical protein
MFPKKVKKGSKSKKQVLVAYCTKGYRLLNPDKPTQVFKARGVIFTVDRFRGRMKGKQPKLTVEVPLQLTDERKR